MTAGRGPAFDGVAPGGSDELARDDVAPDGRDDSAHDGAGPDRLGAGPDIASGEPESADPDVPPVEASSPWRAVGLGAFIIACVVLVYFTPLRDLVAPLKHLERPPWIDAWRAKADEMGFGGQALFAGACALGVAVGFPRLALSFLGGALFGWIEGTVLSQIGTFVGCWATFLAGRHLGRRWVQGLVARRFPRTKALLDFIARHAFEANVVLRMTPVGNAFATNLLFAVSKVKSGPFLAATFVGTLPETAVLALLGSAAKGTEMEARLIGAGAAFVVLALGTAWWTRRLRRRKRRQERRAAATVPAPAAPN